MNEIQIILRREERFSRRKAQRYAEIVSVSIFAFASSRGEEKLDIRRMDNVWRID